jgi:hypothetical protein
MTQRAKGRDASFPAFEYELGPLPPLARRDSPRRERTFADVNKGGFSWKRAVGVTRAKQRVSRKTGIPLTRTGRQRKVGRMMSGGYATLPVVMLLTGLIAVVVR